jgi:hypothetical protein
MSMNLLKKFTLLKALIFIFSSDGALYKFILKNYKSSNSQIFQDLFALYYTRPQKNGFFVEVGVGNGKDLSNTYILEKKQKWKGILCEADTRMFDFIKKNRDSKLINYPISNKCSSNFKFFENLQNPYESSSKKINDSQIKINKSICLNHLLKRNKAPKYIDYISIDTEGTEYNIIKNFNFRKWKIKTITIEHNFNRDCRKKIFNLLTKNQYKRVCKTISYMDDWYVLEENKRT